MQQSASIVSVAGQLTRGAGTPSASHGHHGRPVRAAQVTLLAALALFGTGCMAHEAFMPSAHVTAISPRGRHPAAGYAIQIDRQRVGDATIWSNGAQREDVNGATTTVVHVGFLVDNVSAAPLTLDGQRLRLVDVALDDRTLEEIPALSIEGTTTVEPSRTRELDVRFALPPGVWPSDVESYRVAWSVTNPGAPLERTPFIRVKYPRDDYGPYPYGFYGYYAYSPFYYGPYYYPPGYGVTFRSYSYPRGYAYPRGYGPPRGGR